MPVWSFQLQGARASQEQLKKIVEGDVRIDIVRTTPIIPGFVIEHVERKVVGF
jgi:hypothetical protein